MDLGGKSLDALTQILVAAWISFNVVGLFHFDIYRFILLNLAFSLQF
jgi:uncharacterized membrane protein